MVTKKQQKKKQLFIIAGLITIVVIAISSLLSMQNNHIQVVNKKEMVNPTIPPANSQTKILTPNGMHYTILSQPDIDTSLWNTYTDPILKFSIKYPQNITFRGKNQIQVIP